MRWTTLVLVGTVLAGAAPPPPAARPAGAAAALPSVDRDILHVQVILDKLGFGPGVLTGRMNAVTKAALRGFQESRGLDTTGAIDAATLRGLYQYRAWRPTKTIVLTPGMLAGPYLGTIPKDYEQQSKLPALSYRSPLEKLAEMFHTTPQVLVALNSRETPLRPGTQVVFPNALPVSRNYTIDDAKWRSTVANLNVDAQQPAADHVVVDESEGVLKVFDKDDKLVAQFSATMGSAKFPLPIGTWEIKGSAYNPDWKFDPDLIANTKPGAKEAVVPPGPNNPVGVVWMDLSKEHYGIHGTSEPQNIGQTESNGCIRLTNWDAARLALMIKPGTKAVFRA
ncbi:Lipoprotein-anchoring transpeptidase ErfK/SrfK [Sphingomonas guangdongensis]|uniref:Lipoprotein-anchoring transpeptidase ErfK/SrfK n=1 Tax=Sphingomonas guangdongensis TaxID=1141890 RepID=A0A285R243_9SPHN|nr:L,D-transpeptidase [Sphingomonas guangdongensis]SOB87789.1 Lipoprotein-anchoring transpeptidase ErfK/SrfK [Sphingomonas guangdongensis]